jgi:hypothetical protein
MRIKTCRQRFLPNVASPPLCPIMVLNPFRCASFTLILHLLASPFLLGSARSASSRASNISTDDIVVSSVFLVGSASSLLTSDIARHL